MPLSAARSRKRIHERITRYEGFVRHDGLIDIEARLTDVKDDDLTLLTGVRRAGDPVHAIAVRVTLDVSLAIRAIEVSMDAVPYPGGCESIVAAYEQLIGANLMTGFRRRVHDALGGIAGCTHVNELLGNLPTAAVQTLAGLKPREDDGIDKPFQLDRCHALDTTGNVVRRYYPKWFRNASNNVLEGAGP
ncbi:MAG TPA: DUF2889 domain-containing protein [Casimicrobiaceae bacterium]|nr:DUF2889 domain-containing protein [Casimicrobiaceae bacterium]